MKKLIVLVTLVLLALMGLAKLGIIPVSDATQKNRETVTRTKQDNKAKKAEKDARMKSAPAREQNAALDVMGGL